VGPTSSTVDSSFQPLGSYGDIPAAARGVATQTGEGAVDQSSLPPPSQPSPVKMSEIQCLDEQAQHEVLSTLKNLYIKKVLRKCRKLTIIMKC